MSLSSSYSRALRLNQSKAQEHARMIKHLHGIPVLLELTAGAHRMSKLKDNHTKKLVHTKQLTVPQT